MPIKRSPRVYLLCVLATLSAVQTTFAQVAGEPMTEIRGMWVTRFEWPQADAAQTRAKIDEVMTNLARHRFNAVCFQVRGQADTFYPSPEEPWSPMISTDPQGPGWNPLQYALDSAHKNGLEFHAYINTHVAWQDVRNQPPTNPAHVYYRHFDASKAGCADWLVHDEQGRPVQFDSEDHYVWIAPGVPAAQAYIRRQVMYVVRTYDVDGVHFDRIRMPRPQYSHDPISTARQVPGSEGNPDGLDFADWTRDQFTRMLCDLYAEIAEVKPQIKISAAPVGITRQDRYPDYPSHFLFGWSKGYQDGQAWMAAGALDFIVPQIYWGKGPNPPRFDEIASDWLTHAAGRYVVPGQNGGLASEELARQVRFGREHGAQGNVVFSYGGFSKRGGLKRFSSKNGVYAQAARVPAFPWKDQPTDGILLGTVADALTGEPIIDAWVTRAGSDHVALSSGDGLYSFLKVPPGLHTLTIHKRGYIAGRFENVEVVAGRVTRVNASLSPGPSDEFGAATGRTATTATASDDEVSSQPAPEIVRAFEQHTVEWEQRSSRLKWLLPLLLGLPIAAAAILILIWRRHPHQWS